MLWEEKTWRKEAARCSSIKSSDGRVVVIIAVPGQAELEESSSCIQEVFSLSLDRWHNNMGFLSRKGFVIG